MTDWPFGALLPFCADLIECDPPWAYALRSPKGEGKSAQAHYECMPLDAIKALPVNQLARRDCWLFLWATAPMLPQALNVMGAWGFTYKTRLAWRKMTKPGKNGEPGKVRTGPGYIVRTQHEDVLIGCVGEPHYAKALPSLIDGVAREHSRKPEEFYSLVEAFAPRAYRAALFSRQSRPGWQTWGNETTKFDGEAA